MAITLGKECTVSVDGNVAGVRNVTAEESAEEFTFVEFGSREASVYTTSQSVSVSVESIDDSSSGLFVGLLESGAECSVSGTGFGFTGVVTSVSENQNIDGVRTITATVKKTRQGLRA